MTVQQQYAHLRREIIKKEFAHLNDMQIEAVLKTQGPLLLLAGAGSGKTTVIINRIVNILKYGHGSDSTYVPEWANEEHIALMEGYLANPNPELDEAIHQLCSVDVPRAYEILAITFTNKAAGELKSRLEQAVGDAALDIWAHTFHAACIRILRRDIEKLGYSKNFTIYDEDDKKKLITAVIKEMNLDEKRFDVKSVMSAISRAKDSFENPEEYAINAEGDFYKTTVAKVYNLYQRRMREASALDFDDIIIKTVELLYDYDEVRQYYQRKFKFVLVDEYQDTNHAQYLLCSLLAGGYENICVVGDDDQSIYKFRGATIKNIMEFEKEYTGARTIRLEQNYRSTTNILSAANEVIAQNTQRKGKTLWTNNGDGEKVLLYTGETQEDESEYIAKEILKGIENGDKLTDFTVLYRSHVLSNGIEASFKRHGIQYRIVSGLRFFDRAEVKDVLAYLWLVSNPADTVRLKRVINVPARKIGPKAIETLDQSVLSYGITHFEACEKSDTIAELIKFSDGLKGFANLINEFRQLSETASISQLYEDVLIKSGYYAMLEANADKEGRARIENVLELKSNIVEYEERTENPTLGGFLEEIALFTDLDRYDTDTDAVTMMTMHSAKGLEFPTVFICGVEEGIFPSYRSMESEQELEEERRLCYVGMTRAKRVLHLTNCRRRVLYGQTTYGRPSRFLGEIPEEYTKEVEKKKPMAAQQSAMPKKQRIIPPAHTVTGSTGSVGFTPSLSVGDVIVHKAFGRGKILKTTPIGGDVLLEIHFEEGGKKLMMEKTASKFLTKEN